MKSFIFGKSSLNLPLFGIDFCYKITNTSKHILILSGVHGDEVEGVILAKALIGKLIKHPIKNIKISLVPEFNIEGILLKTRQNYAGVDLNRNLPTKDWTPTYTKIRYFPGTAPCSENENKALNTYLNENKIDFIISLHSWKPMLNINGDCSLIADHISKKTGLIIKDNIGYPTPGSLGTYTGFEKNIPTLTYEIQKGIDMEEILKVHLKPIYDSIKIFSEGKK